MRTFYGRTPPRYASPAYSPCQCLDTFQRKAVHDVDSQLAVLAAEIIYEIKCSPTASLFAALRDKCGVEVAATSRTVEAVPAPPLTRVLEVSSRFPLGYMECVKSAPFWVHHTCQSI